MVCDTDPFFFFITFESEQSQKSKLCSLGNKGTMSDSVETWVICHSHQTHLIKQEVIRTQQIYVRKWWVVASVVSPEIRVGTMIPECSFHLCWVFPSQTWEVPLSHSGSSHHGRRSGSCGIIRKKDLVYCPGICCCDETQVYPTGYPQTSLIT